MFRYKLRTLLIVLALGPPLLFAAYILSIGPAYVLIGAGIVNESSLGWIYEPVLRFCSDHGLHGYIEAYIRWWFSFLGVRE
jgi:hypothetical protein